MIRAIVDTEKEGGVLQSDGLCYFSTNGVLAKLARRKASRNERGNDKGVITKEYLDDERTKRAKEHDEDERPLKEYLGREKEYVGIGEREEEETVSVPHRLLNEWDFLFNEPAEPTNRKSEERGGDEGVRLPYVSKVLVSKNVPDRQTHK